MPPLSQAKSPIGALRCIAKPLIVLGCSYPVLVPQLALVIRHLTLLDLLGAIKDAPGGRGTRGLVPHRAGLLSLVRLSPLHVVKVANIRIIVVDGEGFVGNMCSLEAPCRESRTTLESDDPKEDVEDHFLVALEVILRLAH